MSSSGASLLKIVLLWSCASTACSQGGPWNNPLMMARSVDGRVFDLPVTFQDSSGVPSAIRWKADTLICAFQWFRQPIGSLTWDRVAVKFSFDNGAQWTSPTPIIINGIPGSYQRPFDPTLAVLPSGNLRLYFSSSQGLPPPGLDSSINTYSATSADGINYTFEQNPRVDHPTRRVIDPAVVFFDGSWHYSSPVGAPQEGAYHYTSADGLSYSPENNYPSDNTHNWTGNFLVENNTELRFYGSGGRIWYNTSSDAFSWNSYITTNIIGGDPTTVKLSLSSYLMIYVGPPYATQVSTEEHSMPVGFALHQNYPNPFNPTTTIKYQLPTMSHVTLKVFDVLGREVATLVDEVQDAGYKSVQWNAADAASGVYYGRFQAGDYTATKKLMLLR